MPDVSFGNLLAISVIALLAPLLVGFAPRRLDGARAVADFFAQAKAFARPT